MIYSYWTQLRNSSHPASDRKQQNQKEQLPTNEYLNHLTFDEFVKTTAAMANINTIGNAVREESFEVQQ